MSATPEVLQERLRRLNGSVDLPGSVAYAQETHRLALALWDDAVPWRYLRWRRKMHEVKRRRELHAQAMRALGFEWRA